ncbi:MAG: OmpA family protein [Mariprofundaceae bacterium]
MQKSHLRECWALFKQVLKTTLYDSLMKKCVKGSFSIYQRLNNRVVPGALAFTLLLPLPLLAADNIDATRLEIRNFLKSTASEFSPETIEKAQAYLGSAMLARDRHDKEQLQQSLAASRRSLAEAKRLATDFQKRNRDVLELRIAAREAADNPMNPRLQSGDRSLLAMIQATEKGMYNQSEQHKREAVETYQLVINEMLPQLIGETGRLISKAASAGGKNYAPQTYQRAKQWLVAAKAYIGGHSQEMPKHPRQGILLASQARQLTLQVKQWRRKTGSHEQLILEGRSGRLQIARKLGMKVNFDNPVEDISIEELLNQIDKKQAQQKQGRVEIEKMRKQLHLDLETGLAKQKETLLKQQHEQLSGLKDAFRAKLERETFDKKRHERLRKSFNKGDAEIYSNLDGSILIRISRLKFESGRSSIHKKYFDLLARLKSALEIYSDRKVNIEGHTDNKGDARFNQKLSLKRAESVRDYLISANMDANHLKALGYGEVRPISSNDYDKGRAMNRRIDVIIQAPDG